MGTGGDRGRRVVGHPHAPLPTPVCGKISRGGKTSTAFGPHRRKRVSVDSLLNRVLFQIDHPLTVFANGPVHTDEATARFGLDQRGDFVGHGRMRGFAINVFRPRAGIMTSQPSDGFEIPGPLSAELLQTRYQIASLPTPSLHGLRRADNID